MGTLLSWMWSWPFLSLILCCYLMYRWNLHRECRTVQQLYEGRKQRECYDRQSLSGPLRRCFLGNLAAAAGRANPWTVGALLCLGGAGSLLWMLLAAPFCLFLRFVQVSLLTPLGEQGEEREGRLSSLADRWLGTEMHLSSGRWLSRGLKWTGAFLALSMAGAYSLLYWIEGTSAVPFRGAALALCLISGWTLRRERGLPGAGDRAASLAVGAYLAVLLLIFLQNLRPMTVALEAVVSDGFQMGSYAGPLFDRGGRRAVTAGIAMSCYVGGLTQETSARRYLRCLREEGPQDEREAALTAGLLSAAEAAASIIGIGFGTGLILLCCELSRMGGLPAGGGAGMTGLSGGLLLILSAVLTGYGGGRELFSCAEPHSSRWDWMWPVAAWFCVMAVHRVLPVGENGGGFLLLAVWPVLLCHLLGWIGLSGRFRKLWADRAEF